MNTKLGDWLVSIAKANQKETILYWFNLVDHYEYNHSFGHMNEVAKKESFQSLIRETADAFDPSKLCMIEDIFIGDLPPRRAAMTKRDIVVKINFGPDHEYAMLFYYSCGAWYPSAAYDHRNAIVGKTCYDDIYFGNPFFLAIGNWLASQSDLTLFTSIRQLILRKSSASDDYEVLPSNIDVNLKNLITLKNFNIACCYHNKTVSDLIRSLPTNEMI